ncbi:very short patch repair endonuclease [Nonomuraea endophytica]|uniref:DNA mismatch endonuclease (Patch repair protein) n=1 Tax=Nonomuraea endophytica TaxID=714136 RepID=A0A7W7ZXI4_9ACTN|nr:very short patch repair endonuclease [Nonomuraea endophytica]MBB5075646.1 DNA mismatch endonuclease (patch repair protein) [Nonomuraea endophytica]
MSTDQPVPRDEGVSRRMRSQREFDTGIEVTLRKLLWNRGLRYRVHAQVIPGTRRKVDLVFPRAKVAVFVDGCFWHGCPRHYTAPANNNSWWLKKVTVNRARDIDSFKRLRAANWRVIRVWEHQDLVLAADRIEVLVRAGGKLDM